MTEAVLLLALAERVDRVARGAAQRLLDLALERHEPRVALRLECERRHHERQLVRPEAADDERSYVLARLKRDLMSCDELGLLNPQISEEVRQWFRARQRMTQAVSLADKRRLFVERFAALQTMMLAA